MKLLTESGSAGTLSVTDRFVGCRTTPGVDKSHVFAIRMYPGAPLAVASAQNATSEDRFVKSKRSLDVGDSEKVRDGKPLLWRHLIAFPLDLYFVHGRLQFGLGGYKVARRVVSKGMSVSNSREKEGNPCRSTIVGASFGPASR